MPQKPQFIYDYARPAVTVDLAVISIFDRKAKVLLIRRGKDPFAGKWALPGGFVEPQEPLEHAARRELREETGVEAAAVWPVNGFGDPGRDPRGWVISVAYYALLPADSIAPRGADDASEAAFHSINRLPAFAFDHSKVLRQTIERLRRDLYVLPVARPLLPGVFSTAQLHKVYLALDPRAPTNAVLKKRLVASGLIASANRELNCFRFLATRTNPKK